MRAPDYEGGGLVNLAAELEQRLSGRAPSPALRKELSTLVPEAASYVLVLMDGLGDLQLMHHPQGEELRGFRVGALDAPFSSQTSVATATLATGLPPSRHGLISYLLRLPTGVTNTLWWFTSDGSVAQVDLEGFLPAPNLAERMRAAGIETVVVEPSAYLGSPLDRVLYRGGRTVGTGSMAELVETVLAIASEPGRLVVAYLPHVDAAGHTEGTSSPAYTEALASVTRLWARLAEGLPDHAALVGTADHGMVDVDVHVEVPVPETVAAFGDARVLYLHGAEDACREAAEGVAGTYLPFAEVATWWGPTPRHPDFADRAPTALVHAEEGVALHAGDPVRLVGYHGGTSEAELRIPLLISLPGGEVPAA